MSDIKKKLAIPEKILLEIKMNNYHVFYGTSPENILPEMCFRNLNTALKYKNILYYLLPLENKTKLAHINIIMSIAKMFKSTYTFKIKSLEPNLLLIIISNIKNISPTMKEVGYLLITTLIRTLDSENNSLWHNLITPKKITTIKKLIANFYSGNHYGHDINSTFTELRDTKLFLPFLDSYINNITSVFGTKKYKLNIPGQGLKFRNEWNEGRGFNYAYNVVERVISGELT